MILHAYKNKNLESKEIEKYCDKVYYYKRNGLFFSNFSKVPFIVFSRRNKLLIERLLKDSHPIIFEGIHTTYPLLKNNFSNRIVAVRMHNIEQNYYNGLASNERRLYKKLFFKLEAIKIKKYESIINKVNFIFTISPLETQYYQSIASEQTRYIPVFHENDSVVIPDDNEQFALFHGNLSVSENTAAVNFLIAVFKEISYRLVVAGSCLPKNIATKISMYSNISFVDISDDLVLKELFLKTHIHVLPTSQNTGIKLKLINALYSGKHVIANDKMALNTGLESACIIANSVDEYREKVLEYATIQITSNEIKNREELLKEFQTNENALKIVTLFKLLSDS